MKNMVDRAIHYMSSMPDGRTFTLTELRKAAGISIRSQYRLSQGLLNAGAVDRHKGEYVFVPERLPSK